MKDAGLAAKRQWVIKIIKSFFGSNARTATAIATAESGLNCEAVNWDDAKITGRPSLGLFQLNRPYHEKYFDCAYNVYEAYKLFLNSGFRPWSMWKNGVYRQYL